MKQLSVCVCEGLCGYRKEFSCEIRLFFLLTVVTNKSIRKKTKSKATWKIWNPSVAVPRPSLASAEGQWQLLSRNTVLLKDVNEDFSDVMNNIKMVNETISLN